MAPSQWFGMDVRQDSPIRSATQENADEDSRIRDGGSFGLFDEDLECAVDEEVQHDRFDSQSSNDQSGMLLTDVSVGNLMGGMFHSRPRASTSQSEEEHSFLLGEEERQHQGYGAAQQRYGQDGNHAIGRQDSTDMPPRTRSSVDLERPQSIRPSRMLVLDMLNVSSIDASAARNCFNMLRGECLKHNCGLVYARCNRRVAVQLHIHGCLDTIKHSEEKQSEGRWIGVRHFATIEEAMDFCESTLLAEAVDPLLPLAAYQAPEVPIVDSLSSETVAEVIYEIAGNNGLPRPRDPEALELSAIPNMAKENLKILDEVASMDTFEAEETIFRVRTASNRFFVLLAGTVELCPDSESGKEPIAHPLDSPDAPRLDRETSHPLAARLYRGAIFGFVDFHLAQSRRFSCVAKTRTRVASFSAEDLRYLLTNDPVAAWALNSAVLYYSSVELANSNSL
eukprot:scaffold53_cov193-Pinguiococcus_pyrenoidosus.AAC.72